MLKQVLEKRVLALRRCGWALGWLVGGVVLSACPPLAGGGGAAPQKVLSISFDKNGGDTEAVPSRVSLPSSEGTLGYLPQAPTRKGFVFVGWNKARDGRGERFTEDTPLEVDILLIVYAQWKPVLNVEVQAARTLLTPLPQERSARVEVVVSGFQNTMDARSVALEAALPEGVELQEVANQSTRNTRSVDFLLAYDGVTAFPEGTASLRFHLVPAVEGYPLEEHYLHEAHTLHLRVVDGQEESRPIELHQGNIGNFNTFANTWEGLRRHYRLTQDIRLEAPVAPETRNWTPIGRPVDGSSLTDHAFAGSFDGDGFKIVGLTLRAPNSDYQGFFGIVSALAKIKNLGLEEVHISGRDNVGSLVGWTNGTVRNSYATGSVEGHNNVGGLVGWLNGTVHNSYATGNVEGSSYVGGLVGWIQLQAGGVHNSYATGAVEGNSVVGGLVGGTDAGTVQNSVALNPGLRVTAGGISERAGRVVGATNASLINNYARSSMPLDIDGGFTFPFGTSNSRHGANTSLHSTAAFWEALWADAFENVWTWNAATGLPVLREVGGEQNHRLQDLWRP